MPASMITAMVLTVEIVIIAATISLVVAIVPMWMNRKDKTRCIVVGGLVIVAALIGTFWFFTKTALGQTLLAEACGNCGDGQRTVTVYAADGDIIAQYTGDIEILRNDAGEMSFIFEGNRYTYYNCSVECISVLPGPDNKEE